MDEVDSNPNTDIAAELAEIKSQMETVSEELNEIKQTLQELRSSEIFTDPIETVTIL